MEQTNIIGRTYISVKTLSMDIRTSEVDEIVKKGSNIISGYIYFRGKYPDVSKAVKLSRSKVKKYVAKMRTIRLNSVNTGWSYTERHTI